MNNSDSEDNSVMIYNIDMPKHMNSSALRYSIDKYLNTSCNHTIHYNDFKVNTHTSYSIIISRQDGFSLTIISKSSQ